MAVVGELLVLIGANNNALTAGLAKSEAELKGFSGTAMSSMAAVGLVGAALAAGTAVIGIAAVKSASEFQASMQLIHTQAGASSAEVEHMTSAVLALAPAVGTGPEALAAALFHIESTGHRGADALNILTLAAQGAKVGHADLEATTNALLATVNSGIGGVRNMSEGMGVLNAIVGAGNMRMEDLTGAMSTGILSAAATFGVSIQSVGAALATMTFAGVPAEEGATRLRMTLSLLGAPSAKAVKDLQSIGISHLQLAADMRSPGGILTAIQDLRSHLDDSGLSATKQAALISDAFGGGRSSSAIMLLLNSVDHFGVVQKQVTEGAGGFSEAWQATTEDVAFKFDKLGTSIDVAVKSIGLGLLPLVGQLLDVVTPVVGQVAAWATANQGLAGQILLIAGGVGALLASTLLLGPVLGAIGTLVGIITSPILLAVAAIAGLAAHFGLLGENARTAFDGIASTVLATLGDLAAQVTAWIGAQIPAWSAQLLAWGQAFVGWITPMIGQAIAMLGEMAGQVAGWIGAQAPAWANQLLLWGQAFVAWVQPMIGQAIGALGQLAGQIGGWIVAQIPGITAQIGRWAQAFFAWIGPMILPAIGKLGDFAASVVQWIGAQLPGLLRAFLRWVDAFVAWIGPAIPQILLGLAAFGLQVVGWIIRQIPAVAAAIAKMAVVFVEWVAAKIPGVLGELGKFIGSILDWMLTVPGKIWEAARSWGKAIFDGMMAGIGDIAKAVGDKLNEIPGVRIVGGVVSFTVGGLVSGPGQGQGGGMTGTNPLPGGTTPRAPQSGMGGVVLPAPTSIGRQVPTFALGGVMPWTGLAMLHAGEVITPPGGQGGTTTHVTHTHIHLDGREILDFVEEHLFKNASSYSSGFSSGNPTGVGA